MASSCGVNCPERQECVADIINDVLASGTTRRGSGDSADKLRKYIVDLKKYVGCQRPSKQKYKDESICPSCFAHALVRVYDASLDWLLVDGEQVSRELDMNALAVPVFSALFAEIGKSKIPRENIGERVKELKSKQDGKDGIINRYREQARNVYERILGERSAPTLLPDEKKSILHQVITEANLYPGPYRVRKCSPHCKKCRKKIDDAVDWLERDGNQGNQPTAALKKDISNLRDGIEGHRSILRGRRPMKKYFHITRCEPCYFYSMLKTCGTKRAGWELVGADARRDARDGTEFPIMDATTFEDLERGQAFMRLARRGRGHYIN
jgi:hypothetical protein